MTSLSVFVKDVEADPDMRLSGASLIAVASAIAAGFGPVCGAFAGFFSDRFGTRLAVIIAAVCCSSALLFASFARSASTFLILYGPLMGIASGFMVTPGAVAAGNRFERFRALAMGGVYAGGGLGSALVPLAVAAALGEDAGTGHTEQWRVVMRYLSFSGAITFVAALFIVGRKPSTRSAVAAANKETPNPESPAAVSLAPEAALIAVAEAVPPPAVLSLRENLRLIARDACTVSFAVEFSYVLLYGFSFYCALYYCVVYAHDQGIPGGPYSSAAPISLHRSALLLLALGLSQAGGSMVLGLFTTQLNPYVVYAVTCTVSAVAMAAWPFLHRYWALAVVAVAIGASSAGSRLCIPCITAQRNAGSRNAGAMMGLTLMGYAGALAGPSVLSVIVHHSGGSYTVALLIAAAGFLVSGFLCAVVLPRLPLRNDPERVPLRT